MSRALSKAANARRLQEAIVDLRRITSSRRLGAARSGRAGIAITPDAAAVLRQVVKDGPLRPGLLSDHLRMRPSALTRQLKNLEADGCVERIPAPDDARGALLRATPRGRAAIRRLERADDEILGEQLRSWSAADLQQLVDLLDRLVLDLRTPPPTAPRSSR